MSAATDSAAAPLRRLLDLVPVHQQARDLGPGGEPGPLTGILTAVAGELGLLEEDVQRLYDGWFIETCEEWLVPYLADLVGLREVPPDLGVAVSRRALVANTVAYRRRKGTVAVLEQVTRDVTGWPTRAVEHHPLLATSAHLNHLRLDRPAVASLRDAERAELAAVISPPAARATLDPFQHSAEVRRIASGRGRYGIRNVGVFPFAVQTYTVGAEGAPEGWSRATAVGDWIHFDPFGRQAPLFAPPRAEEEIERLATEPDLPLPLRPRRLLAMLEAVRKPGGDPATLPFGIRLEEEEEPLAPERIRVCGLEPLAAGGDPQVAIDPIAGRLRAFRAPAGGGKTAAYVPDPVFVRYAYGAMADVGAGTYDRSEEHESVLESDLWRPPERGNVAAEDRQLPVPESFTIAAALKEVEESLDQVTSIVSVADSDLHDGSVHVFVPRGARLVLVAASWPERVLPGGGRRAAKAGVYVPDGLRPHVRGTISIGGDVGSTVVLDGLMVEGNLVVDAEGIEMLTIAHCTITGRVQVRGEEDEEAGVAPLQLRLVRSVVGRLELGATVPLLTATDSVIDHPEGGEAPPIPGEPAPGALEGEGTHAVLEGTTVRGRVSVLGLEASSCVLDGTVEVLHRQTGCVRFSFVGPGSQTPRRHRCAPPQGEDPAVVPVYVATDSASPAYLALAPTCSPLIAAGGEGETEMGVHHHLKRPLRLRAAQRQLEPYLPVGTELGVFGG